MSKANLGDVKAGRPSVIAPLVPPLEQIARDIGRAYEQCKQAFQAGAGYTRQAGVLLIEARKQVEGHNWLAWLSDNVPFTERTAQRYIRIAEDWDRLSAESDSPSHLGVREALNLLADTGAAQTSALSAPLFVEAKHQPAQPSRYPSASTVDCPAEPPAADGGEGQCSARQVLDALAGRLDELARVARKAARLAPGERHRAVTALRQALALEGQELAQREESTRIKQLLDSLTPREREVFFLVAAGMANKNIGASLGICLQTVKLHRGHVMQKLQVDSVADLVHLAEKVSAVLPGLPAST